MSLDVLHEDDHLIILSKPAGVVVHPTYKHGSGTLLDALRSYGADWPASHNPTIVGRLDRQTSGIVVAAKHAGAHAALQRTPTQKHYLAVVCGNVDAPCGEIDFRLRVDPADRRRVVVSPDGRACLTRFERLAHRDGVALLRCELLTGRRHQIRAHLAVRGWPIAGDPVYGPPTATLQMVSQGADALRTFPRQALHAWRIQFTHPIGGGEISVEAPVPLDLSGLLAACGLERAR